MIYTAGIFLFNATNEILLVHPTNSGYNNWSIPKGIVEENESVIEGAIRELFEETNVNLNDLKPVFISTGDNVKYKSGKKTLCPIFSKVIVGLDKINFKCNSLVEGKDFYENDRIEWFNPFDALSKIHETQRIALENYLNTH